jgi:hydroxymethylpyrimidine/phosphomethylpyrimidine kinase
MKNKIKKDNETYPSALTIAGSDSGGGAGIQADLRTFSAFGVFGTSAITAVTAQNPCEVRTVAPLDPAVVKDQIEAVFAKFAIKSIKTGMLHNRDIIKVIADSLKGRSIPLVIDPVMISTSGVNLIESSAVEIMKAELFPLAAWVTPNIPEAEELLNIKITTIKDMKNAAKLFASEFKSSCIIKGGHAFKKENQAVDAVCSHGNIFTISSPLVEISPETEATLPHGTGCTFSAAVTAGLALDLTWRDALISAKAFVYGSLSEGVKPGNNIYAMYPPAGSYKNKIKIKN